MVRLILFILLLPLCSFANDGNFIYEDARLRKAPQDFSLAWDKHFLNKNYYPLEKEGEGLPSIGLNQLFLSSNNESFISVKWDISGNFPVNRWLDVEDGHLIHLTRDQKNIAFYFSGVSLAEAKRLLNGIEKVLPQKVTSFFDMILPSAHANACAPALDSSNVERSEAARTTSAVGAATISSMLGKCFKGMKDGSSETVTGWGESVRGAVNWVGGELRGWWNNPRKKASQYYNGVKRAVVGVQNFITMVGEVLMNPARGIRQLREKLGEAGQWFGEIFASLSALPLEQKVEMTCALVAGLGTDLILGVLTGTAVAGTILTLTKVASALKKLGKVFRIAKRLGSNGLAKLGFDANTRAKLFRGLKSGKIKDRDLAILDDAAVMNSPVARKMAVKGVTCAI